MMKITRLFQKTIFGVITLFGLIGLTAAFVTINAVDQELTAENEENSKHIAKAVADISVDILLNSDLSTLQARVDQLLTVDGVDYIYITDEHGEIISHTFIGNIPESIMESDHANTETTERTIRGLGDFIEVSQPILTGVAGHVHIGVDLSSVSLTIQKAIGRQVFWVGSIFLLAILLGIMLVNLASRPIQQVQEYAVALAKKEMTDDSKTQALLRRNDDAGDIARLFQYFSTVADPSRAGYSDSSQSKESDTN